MLEYTPHNLWGDTPDNRVNPRWAGHAATCLCTPRMLKIEHMHETGMTMKDIGEQEGISQARVWQLITKMYECEARASRGVNIGRMEAYYLYNVLQAVRHGCGDV